jgi:hypothetical protein
MALFRIHPPLFPLVQAGTGANDVFRATQPLALLTPGLDQDAGAGTDELQVLVSPGMPLTDAHFAGLSLFEGLRLFGAGTLSLAMGAEAEEAFGPLLRVRLAASTAALDLDAAALGAGTGLDVAGRDGDDRVTGGDAADRLAGGGGQDRLNGEGGNDRLLGEAGDDSLDGGAGEDVLFGGAGADVLTGGAGNDTMAGGAEADVFAVTLGGGRDVVRDFELGLDRLDLSAMGISTAEAALALARTRGPHIVFEFADGTRLTLRDVSLAALDADDLILAAGTAPTDIFFATGGTLLSGGSGVGIVGVADGDLGDSFTLTVDDPRFAFLFGAILILADGVPPIEDADEPTITLTITATDSFGLSYSELFVIDVLTPGIETNGLLVAENRGTGTTVGEWGETGFLAVGPLVWEVATPAAPFAFAGNRLVTTEVLDFEAAASHEITVRVTDSGTGRVVERTVTVTVEDQTDTNLNQTITRSFTGTDGASPGAPGQSLAQAVFTGVDNPVGTVLPDFVEWNGSVTGGDGLGGGAGGDATATISDAGAATGVADQISQDMVTINLLAEGGAGGSASPAGQGGRGGDADSRVINWDSAFSGDMDLVFNLVAQGGDGGAGAGGGDGGAGGDAQAWLNGFSSFASGGVNATFDVVAIGGHGGMAGEAGGVAGAGGHAVAAISGVFFGVYAPGNDDTLLRLEATATGGAGSARGDATISMFSNLISLGSGNDVLQLAAYFDGATHTLTFTGNEFHGDTGFDTLDLSGVHGGFGAIVDLNTNSLSFGGGPANFMEGFEEFRGTESADVFRDAVGSFVYRGGSGADVFVFTASPVGGNDSVGDFTQGEDVMDLRSLGYADFAEVNIVYGGDGSSDSPYYAVVVLNGGSSISVSFAGGGPVTLAESDFLL